MTNTVLYKLGARIPLRATEGIDFGDFIEVFNQWIRDQPISGHLLIDVHDYRHVHHGPGVLLVSHQGNFSLDFAEGRPGLVYYRKQPLGSDLNSNLTTVLATLLRACQLLQDPAVGLEFESSEVTLFANDRLLAPATTKERVVLQEAVSALLHSVSNGSGECSVLEGDSRERFSLTLQFPDQGIGRLLEQLGG